MNLDVKALADQLVDLLLDLEPLEGALAGLPLGNRALADLSFDSRSAIESAARELATRAKGLVEKDSVSRLDERDRVTLDLVRYSASTMADRVSVPLDQFTVTDCQTGVFAGLLSALPLVPVDTNERRASHVERLRALPRFLTQAADELLAGTSAGLTASSRGTRLAINQIDDILVDPNRGGLRHHFPGGDAALEDQDRALVDEVDPALRAYRRHLESDILPMGRDDDHPGLAWLPGGDAMYQTAIRYSTSTNESADGLHALGLELVERLHDELREVAGRLWGLTNVVDIHDRLRHDPALRYESADEITETAVAAVRRAEAAAPAWFGEIPKSACAVMPIPDAMAAGSPAAYYYTGALDGSRPGTYFVNVSKHTERFRFNAESIAFHEAVSGHHFQLTIAQDRGDHLAHKLFGDVTTAEGWGLYAERLADEMGLYSDDVARLGLIGNDAWRAARLVLDTGLHAFGWSRQRAIDWMREHVPIDEVDIVAEVDRYIATPGQALAYMVGRRALEGLRRRSAEVLGDRFSVRDFHDVVLLTGPVAPPALDAAVSRWVAAVLS